jgi:hypothetical protein
MLTFRKLLFRIHLGMKLVLSGISRTVHSITSATAQSLFQGEVVPHAKDPPLEIRSRFPRPKMLEQRQEYFLNDFFRIMYL